MHPRVAVGLAAPSVDLHAPLRECGVLATPLGGRSALPGVVAALVDTKTPTILHNNDTGKCAFSASINLKRLTDPRSLPWRKRRSLFGGSLSLGAAPSLR